MTTTTFPTDWLAPKLYNFASILEQNTYEQALKTASMDFIYPHLALMPDAHLGKGATVGSVIPTRGAIMPAAVGVDIGCGMIATHTGWKREDFTPDQLHDIRIAIEKAVPLSAGRYNEKIGKDAEPYITDLIEMELDTGLPAELSPNWKNQLGSLGSGNHFIEITVDQDDDVWLFLHSGSRGVGNKVAMHYIKEAKRATEKWTLPDPDLAYLTEGTRVFDDYINDLQWCQEFAWYNRTLMMDRVIDVVEQAKGPLEDAYEINCHHNYTVPEFMNGERIWLSRKGAIDANKSVSGLIPGSMGAASYVVTGKANPLSHNSSPHGAGRVFSRGVAKRTFTMEDLEARMEGIEWRHTDKFLDEHPDAYKNIDVVMNDSKDLVEVEAEFHQILNVKGY